MLPKVLRKVSSLIGAAAVMAAVCTFAPAALAQDTFSTELTGLTVEQVQVNMPQIRVYVYDSGTEQPEAYLDGQGLHYNGKKDASDVSTAYYILLDVSGSIRSSYFSAAKQQVAALANQLGAEDCLTLITFGDTVEAQTYNKQNTDLLLTSLDALQARDQNTHLYEAIHQGLEFASAEDGNCRQVMLIVSDGLQDTGSIGITRQEIEQQLALANMPVYSFCVDYADKKSQEEFGRFARTTGGSFATFNVNNAGTVWTDWLSFLDEAEVLGFEADTNRIDGALHTLLLKTGAGQSGESYTRQVGLTNWIPDETAPQVTDTVYDGTKNTVTITFSEAVLHADDAANYQLKKGGKVQSVKGVAAGEEANTWVLTLSGRIKPGQYTLTLTGICDDSMEQNALSGEVLTFKRAFELRDAVPYVLVVLAVALLAVLAVLLWKKLKNREVTQIVKHEHKYEIKTEHVDIKPQDKPIIDSAAEADNKTKIELEIIGGAQAGQRFAADIDGSSIWGRSRDLCNISFTDGKMSRQHCALEVKDKSIVITDLDSHNGTYVNGVRLTVPCILNCGDTIRIGDTTLRVCNIRVAVPMWMDEQTL